jgi:broad specificity phosphatase PhoE
LLLIRHAHVEANDNGKTARLCGWYDAPLSPLGRQQVLRLRSRLASEPPPAVVYASPLQRAMDTARAAPDGLEPHPMEALREIHCGALDGLLLAQVRSEYPELWQRNLEQADETFTWPGGESYLGFRLRALTAIRAIAERHPGERVLIVTHAGVISQVLGTLAGASPAAWESFRPANASITELLWHGNDGAVLSFNDRDHLGWSSAPPVALPATPDR